jgi:fumarate reductase iron-sulfur subunit
MTRVGMDMLQVLIWHGDEAGRMVRFKAPRLSRQTVLDVVTWVQRNAAADLAYRFACRVGMCGSCAMTVNGAPRWTCRTRVQAVAPDGRLEIRPLRNFPIIKDLAVDMEGFFERWKVGGGAFRANTPAPQGFAAVRPEDRHRREADLAVECIGCGVCYAACDTAAGDADYLGPAALSRAWVAVNDARDGDTAGHLRDAAAAGGAHRCHSQGGCTRFCPVGLDPQRSLSGLKRALVWGRP